MPWMRRYWSEQVSEGESSEQHGVEARPKCSALHQIDGLGGWMTFFRLGWTKMSTKSSSLSSSRVELVSLVHVRYCDLRLMSSRMD